MKNLTIQSKKTYNLCNVFYLCNVFLNLETKCDQSIESTPYGPLHWGVFRLKIKLNDMNGLIFYGDYQWRV